MNKIIQKAAYIISGFTMLLNVTVPMFNSSVHAAPITTTLTPTFDTQIAANKPTSYYPNSSVVYAQNQQYEAFFRYDASAQISADRVLTAVTFQPYINYVNTTSGVLNIYSINNTWNDRSTWNNSATQRASCSGTPLASLAVSAGKKRVSISLPLSSVAPDGSINFCATTANGADQLRIASMDDATNKPYLHVTTNDANPSDTTPPTTPSGLSATPTSSSAASLSWQASTDNVGVTGYQIFRDGTNIANTQATTYSDSSLTASTTYSYVVRATDSSGNVSSDSNAAIVTTLEQTPIATTVFTLDDTSITDASSWAISNVTNGIRWTNQDRTHQSPEMYAIGPDGQTVATVSLTGSGVTYIDPEAAATVVIGDTPYVYESDAGGNLDKRTAIYVHRFVEPILDAATANQQLSAVAESWTFTYPASDLNANRTAGPDIEAMLINPNTGQLFFIVKTALGLTPGSISWGIYAAPLSAVNAPGNYALTKIASTTMTITDASWSADGSEIALRTYDNAYVYKVQDEDVATTLATTPLTITTPNMQQSEGIAFSADGKALELSTEEHGGGHAPIIRQPLVSTYQVAPITIVKPPAQGEDTTPPSAPTSLVATAVTAQSVNLAWGASSDNVGVAEYEVFRNNQILATTSSTTFTDTTTAASSYYAYTIRAVDANGNISNDSEAIQVTTPDASTPVAPDVTNMGTGTSGNDTSSYATSSVDAPSDGTLLLYVTAGRTDGTAAYPQTVSGLGASWSLVTTATVGSGNLKSAVYKTSDAFGTGAVTVTFAGVQQNFTWQLVKAGSSQATISRATTYSGVGTAPSVTFSQSTGAYDAAIGFIVSNSTSQAITPATGYSKLGTSQSNTVPSLLTDAEWKIGTTSTLGFTVAGTNQKSIIGLVVSEPNTSGGGTTIGNKVAIIGDSLTYQNGNGVTNITNMLVANGYAASDTYVYGIGGKAMTAADSQGKTTLQNINEARAALGSVNVWVIALGTNNVNDSDATFQNNINTIMNAIGPTDTVIWIGMAFYGASNTNAAHFNPITQSTLSTYSNAHFADWNSFIHNGRDETGLWVYPVDYTHMTDAGYVIRNTYYLTQINSYVTQP